MSVNSELAIIFPGQGSQSIGMMDDLKKIEPNVKNVFDRGTTVLSYDVLSYDLWEIVSQ